VRMFSARVLPDGVCDAGDDRPVRTSLRRGPAPVVLVCGVCANWLAVGHHPHDAEVRDILLVCAACHRINDPSHAVPAEWTGAVAGDQPAELARAEVWGRSVVERVHVLAAQERRWPWRADAG
jgi:hypothetical protein